MEELSFKERVYELCRQIPRGKVATYRSLAHALGTKAYRAVGAALRVNPYAPATPCHRVVRSDGSLGGFRGEMSGEPVDEKTQLLCKEGVVIQEGQIDLKRFEHHF